MRLTMVFTFLAYFCYSQNYERLNKNTRVVIYISSAALSYNVIACKDNDKFMHWFISAGVTTSTMMIDKKIGIASSLALGIGKEIYDSQTGGYFSMADMQANLTGILFGIAINMLQNDSRRNYSKKFADF